jgi:Delta7-sterol 5-desaturase
MLATVRDLILAAFAPGAGLASYVCLVLAIIVVTLVVTAATWAVFELLNRWHPENVIQPKGRRLPVWRELKSFPLSVTCNSICLGFGLFAQGQGWTMAPLPVSWWSVPLMFVVSLVLYDAWFYWTHRLLHSKALIRFHKQHHTAITPSVWSVHNEGAVDAFTIQSYFAVATFIAPIPAVALIATKMFDQITALHGHSGYDMHHSTYRFNFAHTFSLWDRLMGTLHPDYDRNLKAFEPGETRPAERITPPA